MAVGHAYVFPGFLTPVLTELFFQSLRLLLSHASAEVRGENTPERKVASTRDRTHNPGHEFDTLTTKPPGWGKKGVKQGNAETCQLLQCIAGARRKCVNMLNICI